jgi:hypothetical protein
VSRTIVGWRLPHREREQLLAIFAPRYAEIVADHVTLKFGTDADTPLPFARSGEIVGEVDDGEGAQALLVRIDGTTDRGDGSHYHITWSRAPGREAKESNDVLAATSWRRVHPPVKIALEPARWIV